MARRVLVIVLAIPVAVGIGFFLWNVRENALALERAEAACEDIERLMVAPQAAGAGAILPIIRALCEETKRELTPTSRINYGRRVSIAPPAEAITALEKQFDDAGASCLSMLEKEIASDKWSDGMVADVLRQMIKKDGGDVSTSSAADVRALAKQTCDAMLEQGRARVADLKERVELPIWEWPDELSVRADRVSMAVEKADVVVAFGRVLPEGAPLDASNASRGVRLRSKADAPLVVDVLLEPTKPAVRLNGRRGDAFVVDGAACRNMLRGAGIVCMPQQLRIRVRSLAPGETVHVEPVD